MTVNEAHKTVKGLIGEDDFRHASGVLCGFYDIAQKQIATTVCPVEKSFTAPCGEPVPLPDDLFCVSGADAPYTLPDKRHILLTGSGSATVRYHAYPADITEDADGDTGFEIDVSVQSAIPLFAAAHAVLSDSDMRRYYAFIDAYNTVLRNAESRKNGQAHATVVRTEDMR